MAKNKNCSSKQALRQSSGQAALTAVIFFILSAMTLVVLVTEFAAREIKITRTDVKSKKSFILTDGALEDAIYRLKSGKNLPDSVNYQEGDTSVTLTKTINGNQTTINSQADTGNIIRKETAVVTEESGVLISVSHAAHAGAGSLNLGGWNDKVYNGPAYSNNTIECGWFANGVQGENAAAYAVVDVDDDCDVNGPIQEGVAPKSIAPADLGIDIDYWKEQAVLLGGQTTGSLSYNGGDHDLGPKKINGNLTISGNADVTLHGTLHIIGDLYISGGSDLKLYWEFGSKSTVVVVDGHTTADWGDVSGRILIIMPSNGGSATLTNDSEFDGAVVYAPNNGSVNMYWGSKVAGAIADSINTGGWGNTIWYRGDLANMLYAPTPAGAPSGTPTLESWREIP